MAIHLDGRVRGLRFPSSQALPVWRVAATGALAHPGARRAAHRLPGGHRRHRAAGYSWRSARHAATESERIESVPSAGSETIWRLVPPAEEDAS